MAVGASILLTADGGRGAGLGGGCAVGELARFTVWGRRSKGKLDHCHSYCKNDWGGRMGW